MLFGHLINRLQVFWGACLAKPSGFVICVLLLPSHLASVFCLFHITRPDYWPNFATILRKHFADLISFKIPLVSSAYWSTFRWLLFNVIPSTLLSCLIFLAITSTTRIKRYGVTLTYPAVNLKIFRGITTILYTTGYVTIQHIHLLNDGPTLYFFKTSDRKFQLTESNAFWKSIFIKTPDCSDMSEYLQLTWCYLWYFCLWHNLLDYHVLVLEET